MNVKYHKDDLKDFDHFCPIFEYEHYWIRPEKAWRQARIEFADKLARQGITGLVWDWEYGLDRSKDLFYVEWMLNADNYVVPHKDQKAFVDFLTKLTPNKYICVGDYNWNWGPKTIMSYIIYLELPSRLL